jgi:transposase-like protein
MNTTPTPQKPVYRTFSAELKRAIVHELEQKLVTIAEVAAEYAVSRTSIYRWIARFGKTTGHAERLVLQRDSEQYQSKQLRQRVLELEAALGRKQLEIDYLTQLLRISSAELGIDLKKSSVTTPSTLCDDQGRTAE